MEVKSGRMFEKEILPFIGLGNIQRAKARTEV